MCYNGKNWVSIHASVKDATGISWYTHAFYGCFNPRICKRCDKGFGFWSYLYPRFNPRICKRCDSKARHCCAKRGVSIHASVKDATRLFHLVVTQNKCFNPRICKRCDAQSFNPMAYLKVSIHASVKDATQFRGFSYKEIIVSIHASVKDATHFSFSFPMFWRFQSTHL